MRNVIFLFFSTIMITGLGFGLEHTVLEPIPGFDTVPERDRRTENYQ